MGINVGRIKLAVYGGLGMLSALAGIVYAGRLGNGSPNAGTLVESTSSPPSSSGTSPFEAWPRLLVPSR